jgi:hypothetical protein
VACTPHAPGSVAYYTSCYKTADLNNWDGELSLTVATNQVITGLYSYHEYVDPGWAG